jgi:hypothetical protein
MTGPFNLRYRQVPVQLDEEPDSAVILGQDAFREAARHLWAALHLLAGRP